MSTFFVLLWHQNIMLKITNIQITIITIMMILSVFFQPKVKEKIFLTSIYNLNLKMRSHFAIILSRKDNRIPSIFILYYKRTKRFTSINLKYACISTILLPFVQYSHFNTQLI